MSTAAIPKPLPRLAFSIITTDELQARQLFQQFRPCGFDGLQLKGGQYVPYLNNAELLLQEWGHIQGVNQGLIWGGSLEEASVTALRRFFQFAAALGSELIVFCHARSRSGINDDDLRHYARQLGELGAEAAQLGLKLSLHNHHDNPVMYRQDFEVFFESVNPAHLGLTLDTAHLAKSGVSDIAGIVRDFAAFIDNVHLKDFAAGEFQTLGRGDIDFAPIFAALHAIDYRGYLCVDEESGTEVEESLRASHDFLMRGWQEVAHHN